MTPILDTLEWLARYGFIEIFFGIGTVGLLWRMLHRFVPSNYRYLHVDISSGSSVTIRGETINTAVRIDIRSSGSTNFYIARAYFRPTLRPWWLFWLFPRPTRLKVHPESDRIADRDAYELKFQEGQRPGGFTEYEALVRPGHANGEWTWLALTEAASKEMIRKRLCEVLYIEYATAGHQGIHRVRL